MCEFIDKLSYLNVSLFFAREISFTPYFNTNKAEALIPSN